MKRIIILNLLIVFVFGLHSQNAELHVTIRTITPINSNAYTTELPNYVCEVARDVYYNGELLIKENTPVDTRIEVYKARSRNRVGSITIYFIGVNTIKGQRVFFNESYTKGGKLRRWRCLHGKNAYIPPGTMINVLGIYEK